MTWQHWLRVKTQDPTFLWTMTLSILVTGVAAGWLAQFAPKSKNVDSKSIHDAIAMGWESPDDLTSWLQAMDDDVPFDFRLVAISHLELDDDQSAAWSAVDLTSGSTQRGIASQLLLSIALGKPTPQLDQMANTAPATRHANQAIGALHLSQRSFGTAGKYFEREGLFEDAEIARQFALDVYGAANDSAAIERLAKLPPYAPLISPSERLLIAESNRDWTEIFRVIVPLTAERFKQGFATLLAIIAGIGWFVLAARMGRAGTREGARLWLCGLAIVMGGLSIPVTSLVNIWQELDWGITESNDLIEGIKFYVLGVGFREEFAKLLMLLPLMPIIVRRRSPIEALIVSACVGLGFAIVENMGYFARSSSTDSMGRFLTANFAHMSMTGLIGLSFARFFWKKQDISHALLTFLLVMLAHGFYDATIAVPGLQDLSIAGTIIFILLAYAFFHEVRSEYQQTPETISLTASFLFIVSMLTAITFVYVSWRMGFAASVTLLAVDVLGLGVMVYMYLREMPNSLIH
ncbi:hypothetical protein Poly51_56540 [Rubripirellula tenax]|uniref:Protease PrsW n=1 Tax=Rubripirellula tenax TaxID=2528015 RepID=A0A5C6EBJ4_9BACT|nr:PrsW family glutamic-type intramembrane protease [Rubripirellula tenax]TWU46258.1 hypothetical protein Poly51_56540 [Rubripirellula tenax]